MSDKMGHELTPSDKYALSIDYALACMCMGYGTVDARTVTEVWFSILCMMVAGAVYAYVIGGICEALSNEDPATKQFREALDMLNGFFRKQSVPLELRTQCHTYMDVYRRKIDESVYNQVFSLFTPELQQKLAVSMMTQMVRDAQVLKWAHSSEEAFFKKELALQFECSVFPMQESIFKQYDVSDAMYVVCKGLVRCASDNSSCSVSLFAQGHCFGWEMIRNVAFAGNKYKRINSADSFTVVLLQKLRTVKLREALEKKELRKTRKRIRRAAHWCLVRECVVSLGTSVLVVKAAADLPLMTPEEKRRVKEFYHQVAKAEAKAKVHRKLAEPVFAVMDEGDVADVLENTDVHIEKLKKFGGSFLNNLKKSHPTTDLSNLPQFVSKARTKGRMTMADVVAASKILKVKKERARGNTRTAAEQRWSMTRGKGQSNNKEVVPEETLQAKAGS
jgi:1,2-phenylacetyl-CoA epoxidase PaaB subunit